MRLTFKLPAVAVASLLLLSSCYYDKEEQLYPVVVTACDTTGTISYLNHIQPILQRQCYTCHNSSLASGGVVMGTYSLDNALASNGKLYGTISYAAGFSPMPQGTAKLSSCNLTVIKKWIDSGAKNN